MTSAYQVAGLARNPFVADGVGIDRAVDRHIALPVADFVQVTGKRGAGKTTLIKQWQLVHGGTYHHVEQGRGRWRPVPIRLPIVYWDEADRLPGVVVRRGLQAARLRSIRVVVGTHRNLVGPALAARMSTAVVRLDRLDAELLREWVELRINEESFDPVRARQVLGEAPIDSILAESGASWRAAGDHLHRWAAERVASQQE